LALQRKLLSINSTNRLCFQIVLDNLIRILKMWTVDVPFGIIDIEDIGFLCTEGYQRILLSKARFSALEAQLDSALKNEWM